MDDHARSVQKQRVFMDVVEILANGRVTLDYLIKVYG
jgi:hypothetical protein